MLGFVARAGKHDELVLALAIALWRSHGDNQNTGILEYYKRLAFGADASCACAELKKPSIKLKSPNGNTSTVYAIFGRITNIAADSTFDVNDEEAVPLLQAGWAIVEAVP